MSEHHDRLLTSEADTTKSALIELVVHAASHCLPPPDIVERVSLVPSRRCMAFVADIVPPQGPIRAVRCTRSRCMLRTRCDCIHARICSSHARLPRFCVSVRMHGMSGAHRRQCAHDGTDHHARIQRADGLPFPSASTAASAQTKMSFTPTSWIHSVERGIVIR